MRWYTVSVYGGIELFAAVEVVVGEGANEGEIRLEGAEDVWQVWRWRAGELKVAGDDEPADVAGTGLGEDLRGGVGVGGRVEEQDGELRGATGGEVEGSVAGDEEDCVVGGDLGVGGADELFKGGEPGAGGGEAAEFGEGGAGERAVELDVAEALVAGGVEAAAEKKCCGDDDGERAGEGWDLREKRGDENHEERPESVGRSPELLGEESPVDDGEKDERKERVYGRKAAQAPESVDGGEDEEMRPEREKLASAVGGIGVESEGDDGAEEGCG